MERVRGWRGAGVRGGGRGGARPEVEDGGYGGRGVVVRSCEGESDGATLQCTPRVHSGGTVAERAPRRSCGRASSSGRRRATARVGAMRGGGGCLWRSGEASGGGVVAGEGEGRRP